jgi:hypothetical protein
MYLYITRSSAFGDFMVAVSKYRGLRDVLHNADDGLVVEWRAFCETIYLIKLSLYCWRMIVLSGSRQSQSSGMD